MLKYFLVIHMHQFWLVEGLTSWLTTWVGLTSWHKLHLNRLIVPKIGGIFKHCKNFDSLASRLKSTHIVSTPAIKHGIASEPVAVVKYAAIKDNVVNLYPSGIVINPSSPWLAASPDSKVYDPSRNPSYDLLETVSC